MQKAQQIPLSTHPCVVVGRQDDRYLDLPIDERSQTFTTSLLSVTIRFPSGLKLTLKPTVVSLRMLFNTAPIFARWSGACKSFGPYRRCRIINEKSTAWKA